MAVAHPARHWRVARAAMALLLMGMVFSTARPATAESELIVVVTSTGDETAAHEALCPHTERCTLRRAIEFVNADATDGVAHYVVRFDPDVFPADEPATIAIEADELPVLSRDNAKLDGISAGVIVDGSGIEEASGVVVEGANARVAGIAVQSFDGTCLALTGSGAAVSESSLADCRTGLHIDGGNAVVAGVTAVETGVGIRVDGGSASIVGNTVAACGHGIVTDGNGATLAGNTVRDCSTAVRVAGASLVLESNTIGIGEGGGPGSVGLGIFLERGNARIGHLTNEARANRIGNAQTGIRVGGDGGTASADVLGNTIGEDAGGGAAPVGVGLEIVPPGENVLATANVFANTDTAIVIVDIDGGPASTGNTLRGNTYRNIGTIAIDFGPTGSPVPNGTQGAGPNTWLAHPEFARAVQASITGTVPGPCSQCTVDLYLADRRGGGMPDVPTEAISGATVTTGLSGAFGFSNPPVSPGEWVIAIVTDGEGNTSEFSEAIRVGTGLVQCGNETLYPGWNARGYFGPDAQLGAVFPPGSSPPGPVRSIHQRLAAPGFLSWFSGGQNVNDLSLLQAPEAYWFWADSQVQLPGSLLLTVPPAVSLSPGWNDFVYMGAEDEVDLALGGLDGNFVALFRWVSGDEGGRWLTYGAPETPRWARGFTTMEPCAVYTILVDEEATFVPLQP